MTHWKLRGGLLSSSARLLRDAELARWTLSQFLHLNSDRRTFGKSFIFREQTIRSLGHRYVGRFDYAVLHWKEVPILDAVIERKFPRNYLPSRPRPEDTFQAGLYALGLLQSGVSCSSARLILMYCLQEAARRCIGKNRADCLSCKKGTMFTQRFRPRKVLKALRKLDEVWFDGRKPKASPIPSKCRACPYGIDQSCRHSST